MKKTIENSTELSDFPEIVTGDPVADLFYRRVIEHKKSGNTKEMLSYCQVLCYNYPKHPLSKRLIKSDNKFFFKESKMFTFFINMAISFGVLEIFDMFKNARNKLKD